MVSDFSFKVDLGSLIWTPHNKVDSDSAVDRSDGEKLTATERNDATMMKVTQLLSRRLRKQSDQQGPYSVEHQEKKESCVSTSLTQQCQNNVRINVIFYTFNKMLSMFNILYKFSSFYQCVASVQMLF